MMPIKDKSVYHTNPEEALKIGQDLKSKKVIGMHANNFFAFEVLTYLKSFFRICVVNRFVFYWHHGIEIVGADIYEGNINRTIFFS